MTAKPDIIVNSTSDVTDFSYPQNVSDLPGPDGLVTLREALIAANCTSGAQLVAFNIPKNDGGFDGKVFTIKPGTLLPELYDNGTLIDGSTQTIFSGNTNKTDPEVRIDCSLTSGWGLEIRSSFNLIHSIIICNASGPGILIQGTDANYNQVSGCFITGNGKIPFGTVGLAINNGASHNIIGGISANDRNVISGNNGAGIFISGDPDYTDYRPFGNTITGNFIGTDNTGTKAFPNETVGINIIYSFNNIIEGNVISGNKEVGIGFWNNAHNNSVTGNLIGTDYTGTRALGNFRGIGMWNKCYENTIGGHSKKERNIISGNSNAGIQMGENVYDNQIIGNYIGTDISGQPDLGNGTYGIGVFYGSRNILIGGTENNSGNIIAGNNGAGIILSDWTAPTCTGIRISGNMIYANANGLGIEINMDGVTPNDPGDTDTGNNNIMNYPVLTDARVTQGKLHITGSIDTQNPETVTVEFFANPVPYPGGDPSGYGEGEIYLGKCQPDLQGAINTILPIVKPGTLITTTATDAAGNTSEFSASITAQ